MEAKREVQEEVGERLRVIREALGYSVVDFVEALGTSYDAYRNYERGSANIPLNVLKALRERFCVNINYLITGYGNMFTSSQASGKAYLIGERLKALRDMLSLSSSEFFSYLDMGSEKEFLAIENNEKEATENVLEDICESFSVNVGWLTKKDASPPFRSRRVKLEEFLRVYKMYKSYRPEILFATSSPHEGEPVYLALFLQGNKPFQGILLYESVDWTYAVEELIQVMQVIYSLSPPSVYIVDRDTFRYLLVGEVHAVKATEKGKIPSFPFIPALLRKEVRDKLYYPLSEAGSDDYGLAGIIEAIRKKEANHSV